MNLKTCVLCCAIIVVKNLSDLFCCGGRTKGVYRPLDKGAKLNTNFSYFSTKTYVVHTQKDKRDGI